MSADEEFVSWLDAQFAEDPPTVCQGCQGRRAVLTAGRIIWCQECSGTGVVKAMTKELRCTLPKVERLAGELPRPGYFLPEALAERILAMLVHAQYWFDLDPQAAQRTVMEARAILEELTK